MTKPQAIIGTLAIPATVITWFFLTYEKGQELSEYFWVGLIAAGIWVGVIRAIDENWKDAKG